MTGCRTGPLWFRISKRRRAPMKQSSFIITTECHHENDHVEPFEIETSMVYLANRLSRVPLDDGEQQLDEVLCAIPQWEQTRCTREQIGIACGLAEEQWREVMESLGMLDLDIDDSIEDSYRFDTGIV